MNRRSVVRFSVMGTAVLATAGLAACTSRSLDAPGGVRRSGPEITPEELVEYQSFSVLAVIRRLRPRWLRGRGTTGYPVPFLDASRLGNSLDELDRVNVSAVESIRYLDASEATLKYGTNFPAGAIEVVSRAR